MPRVRLLAIAFVALALSARAEALRLTAPASGTTLRGGSFVALQWSAANLPKGAEEWEAFLSVNGGAYYAFRITPHLEIDLRRFTFIVPNVDARDARILIRVGNEVRETVYETDATFTIVRERRAAVFAPKRLLSLARGESARPGDAPVIAWTDGARDGTALEQLWSPAASRHVRATITVAAEASAAVVSSDNSLHRAEPSSLAAALVADRNARPASLDASPASPDLLLVCRRRNI